MEQQHVYHHHYHYHYIYPFPPGLPPNAPPNSEPLNQEAADRENDEPPADNEEDEEEEDSENDHTDGQEKSASPSPGPVQQEPSTEVERAGCVVFDDSFAIFDLDDLSLEAQARFTSAESNNHDDQEGPPRNEARTSTHPDQLMPQRASIDHPSQPLQSGHLTVIDKARIVYKGDSIRVVNCDPSGPQIDICWRVPGPRNIWLSRLGYASGSRKKLRALLVAQAPPDMTAWGSLEAPLDEEKALSLIECSCIDDNHDYFEGGGGQVVPGDPGSFEFLSALGRMVGFEVVQG